jgi:hypothetical protein
VIRGFFAVGVPVLLVIPAKAGIQQPQCLEEQGHWVTSFAVEKLLLPSQE